MQPLPVRILLIDDDEDDFFLTRNLLGEIPTGNFQLEWVADYQQGLEAVCRGTHDVYLLDYRLGSRSGLELLQDVRRRGCSASIILLTGMSQRDVDVAAMEAGAADFLEKSRLDAASLDRALRYTLLQKRQADELEKKVSERTAELARANALLQTEVAERKRVEDALRESESHFRHLADSMPQIVWVVAADGTLEFINRRWTEYTGLPLEQSRDPTCIQQVIHPDDGALVTARAKEGLRRQLSLVPGSWCSCLQ